VAQERQTPDWAEQAFREAEKLPSPEYEMAKETIRGLIRTDQERGRLIGYYGGRLGKAIYDYAHPSGQIPDNWRRGTLARSAEAIRRAGQGSKANEALLEANELKTAEMINQAINLHEAVNPNI
jgi:hypothetical protein